MILNVIGSLLVALGSTSMMRISDRFSTLFKKYLPPFLRTNEFLTKAFPPRFMGIGSWKPRRVGQLL